jgi:nitrite reductase (NO-forming)
MKRRRSIMLLVAVLALTGLAACGSSSSGGSGKKCPSKVDTKTAVGGAITVCASDIKFDVVTIKAKPGPLKVTLENDGAIYHTLKIPDADVELKTNAGKTATATVTLSKGTHSFDCTVPGHAAAGMKGKIEVG